MDRIRSTRGWEKLIQKFGQKPKGKRPLGMPNRWWEDNIRMDLKWRRVKLCGLVGSVSGSRLVAGEFD